MGYACPVCEAPQQDAEHLANHLAFTAMLGDGDHEDWLDEYTPGWDEGGPDDLAPRVAEHADEDEYPQVFEDTTDGHAEHDHADHGHAHGETFEDAMARQLGRGGGRGDRTAEQTDVLREAREMTREMVDETADGDDESESE